MPSAPRLVLASGSPRRRALLEVYPLEFEVRPADIDEALRPDEDPVTYVVRLARAKAAEVRMQGEIALAADTCVVAGGDILGKPVDADHARAMLERLSGATHVVVTAVAVADDHETSSEAITTEVEMAPIPAADLEWYVGTDEPYDKAGAYAIQGMGGRFVHAIRGSASNVVGLPLDATFELLARHGVSLVTDLSQK